MLNVFRASSVFNAREDGSKSIINVSLKARGKVKKMGVPVVLLLVLRYNGLKKGDLVCKKVPLKPLVLPAPNCG